MIITDLKLASVKNSLVEKEVELPGYVFGLDEDTVKFKFGVLRLSYAHFQRVLSDAMAGIDPDDKMAVGKAQGNASIMACTRFGENLDETMDFELFESLPPELIIALSDAVSEVNTPKKSLAKTMSSGAKSSKQESAGKPSPKRKKT